MALEARGGFDAPLVVRGMLRSAVVWVEHSLGLVEPVVVLGWHHPSSLPSQVWVARTFPVVAALFQPLRLSESSRLPQYKLYWH